MKVEKRDGSIERRVLIAQITNTKVCSSISTRWKNKRGLYKSPWANIIGQWCVDHFRKYGRAPRKAVEVMYEEWEEKSQDRETLGILRTFLSELSRQYSSQKNINPSKMIDVAHNYFTSVEHLRLGEKLMSGNVKEAQEALHKYRRFEDNRSGVSFLKDESARHAILSKEKKTLIAYPGALGEFFGNTFSRESFVSFMGPEKRGKSWWLLDVSFRGMLQRRKVLYLSVGDMSVNDVMERLWVRVAKRPLEPEVVKWPTNITTRGGKPDRSFDERVFSKPMTKATLDRAADRFYKKMGGQDCLKIHAEPSNSVDVGKIQAIIDNYHWKDWDPDAVVLDYADIMAGIGGKYENKREQINENWSALRGLGHQYKCLVVTATQSDADSYERNLIGMSNFADDKRKFGHVTAMIALNQNPEEKDKDLYRLNYVARRKGHFSLKKVCYVAGCLALSNPCVLSTF